MGIDELLRTEFLNKAEALRASGECEFILAQKFTSPLIEVGEDILCDYKLNYIVRKIVLKEFDFPRGQRWKFCIQPIV